MFVPIVKVQFMPSHTFPGWFEYTSIVCMTEAPIEGVEWADCLLCFCYFYFTFSAV